MSEITITATEVVESKFGEKVLLDSPYEAKQYIKYMPWSAEDGVNHDELEENTQDPEYSFNSDFECHYSWDTEESLWTIDANTFEQAAEFFEFVGINVEDNTGLLQ